MPDKPDPLLDVANASGFPLQIAIERWVDDTESIHDWYVLDRERGWALGEQSGFIDLVLRHKSGRKVLAVECKRARDVSWVFLPFDGDPRPRRHINAWVSWYDGDTIPVHEWCDLSGEPGCPEALFCTLRGQDAGAQRSMLERVGAELVASTEALAHELRDFRPALKPDLKVYSSLIVTNVPLMVAKFKPSDISLENGEIAGAEFQEQPWIRFRKQMATKHRALRPEDYAHAKGLLPAREHTIFIVQAKELVKFLSGFSFDDGPLRAMGITERAL